jgi:predicted metal-dependent hydrolase
MDPEPARIDRRKTATVKVEKGKVSVVVPRSTTQGKVADLVVKKIPWIREKLRLQREHQPPQPKEYVTG